jgi:hypothetical protein
MIVIYKPLTQEEAETAIAVVEAWFKSNPRRRVCITERTKVRRGHVREDIQKITAPKGTK